MKLPSSFLKKIRKFVEDHRESEGGWAKVNPKDIFTLDSIIKELLELKYDLDPDGDLPIDWVFVDRTRYYHPFLYHCQMPYPHKLRTLKDYIDQLRHAETNLAKAQAEVTKVTTYLHLLVYQDESLSKLVVNPREE